MINQPWYRKTILAGIGLAYLFLLAGVPGCATKKVHTGETAQEGEEIDLTLHEFPDVPIPRELDLNEKESFVYSVPEMSTGLLVYDGNVDYDSLVRFFDDGLRRNGWELRASLKYPRTMFFYQKELRVCLITITTGTFKSRVQIWVAPLEVPGFEPAEPLIP